MQARKIFLTGLGLWLAAAGGAWGQNGPGGGGPGGPGAGRGGPRGGGAMITFDTDRDGILSAAEIANASQVLLQLDQNGDGQITPDELGPVGGPGQAGPGQGGGQQGGLQNRGGGGQPGDMLNNLFQFDIDQNGQLSREELAAAFQSQRGRGPGGGGPGGGPGSPGAGAEGGDSALRNGMRGGPGRGNLNRGAGGGGGGGKRGGGV